jgi:hypothetical protein
MKPGSELTIDTSGEFGDSWPDAATAESVSCTLRKGFFLAHQSRPFRAARGIDGAMPSKFAWALIQSVALGYRIARLQALLVGSGPKCIIALCAALSALKADEVQLRDQVLSQVELGKEGEEGGRAIFLAHQSRAFRAAASTERCPPSAWRLIQSVTLGYQISRVWRFFRMRT